MVGTNDQTDGSESFNLEKLGPLSDWNIPDCHSLLQEISQDVQKTTQ